MIQGYLAFLWQVLLGLLATAAVVFVAYLVIILIIEIYKVIKKEVQNHERDNQSRR